MTCRRAGRWIEDEASGALAGRERARLEAHLEACPACRAHRARVAEMVRLLACARESAPALDVRKRVMCAVALEAQAARLRARAGVRAFWAAMAASFTSVCLLGAMARSAAAALPAQALPASTPLLRAITGFWTAVRSLAAALWTLAVGLLDAGLYVLRTLAGSLPVVETAAASVVALVLLAAALPLARALWAGGALRRAAGRG